MRNRIDTILLGILWLLASTLGASFWLNTRFGFNIFSAQHWQYLAYLQATHRPVQTLFYVSIAVSVFVMIFGLYLLVRPRLRRIRLPRRNASRPDVSRAHTTPQHNVNTDASTVDIVPGTTQTAPAAPQQTGPAPARPPRLNMPTMNSYRPTPATNTTPTIPPQQSPAHISGELRNMFESAGYVVKPNPKIGNVRTDLFAIGTNENLWIGAVGIPTPEMRRAIDRLAQIFSDTLDDITININGFVIAAPDAATSEFQDILMFDSVAAVGQYISAHPNPPVPDDDAGNFDAYSAYISTVIDYIGKI